VSLPYRVLLAGNRSTADILPMNGLSSFDDTMHDACGKGDVVLTAGSLKPDLIVLYDLIPECDGLDSIRRLKKNPDTEDMPVVLIVPDGDTEHLIRGLDAGADDCLARSVDPRELLARIRAVMRKMDGDRVLRSRREALFLQATTDPLTGLYKRQYLKPYIERSLASVKRHRRHYSLMMLEIDDLTSVSETLGPLSGDGVMKELGSMVKSRLRASDLTVRYDHNALVVVLSDTKADGSFPAAERLRKLVEDHPFPGITCPRITASIGIAGVNREDTGMDDIIGRVEEALAAAIREGKNRVRCL